jgi:hypothetical protein
MNFLGFFSMILSERHKRNSLIGHQFNKSSALAITRCLCSMLLESECY